VEALARVGRPVYVVNLDGERGVAQEGIATIGPEMESSAQSGLPLLGYAPALRPEALGHADFRQAHGLRYAYVAGAMANGIGSVEIVEAMARGGMIGFFGSAGLPLDRVEAAIERVQHAIPELPYGFNLIYSPNEPGLESAVVDLYLRRSVRLISASAYLKLSLPLIRYRTAGIHQDADGTVVTPNRVIAKVSRTELARKFFSPPPEALLRELVESGALTSRQGQMAATIPVAEDLTAEADSGGHTDNRPALSLLPTMLALRDEMQATHGYAGSLRVGAAGGISTPASAAAAFAMGADYVLTGTVNQACVEAGTSPMVKEMLAQADQADVTMAPAADMFEMGVKVQVLKWGTLFAARARKLYEFYRAHDRLEDLPAKARATLERDFFRGSLEETWAQTRAFFEQRDPGQIERADRDPKHKMALVFRSYLGQSSNWANAGDASRKADYQIWCGPAMGAFNEWAKGSCLEPPANRSVATVAMNLLVGAAALTRAGWLRAQGIRLSPAAQGFAPRDPQALTALLD
jgi:PfaD family protein